VGVTKYSEEGVGEEKMKGDQLDRRWKELGRVCVAFAIMLKVEDKEKKRRRLLTGNYLHFRDVWASKAVERDETRNSNEPHVWIFAKSYKLII
jgi:hypothetical protein